jgi:hypothetical protein
MTLSVKSNTLTPAAWAALRPRFQQLGVDLVAKAQDFCPVDTGDLRASIDYELIDSRHVLRLSADTPYAFFVEFGTSVRQAHPFLRPAVLAVSGLLKFAGRITTGANLPGRAPGTQARRGSLTNVAKNTRTTRRFDRRFRNP